MFDSVNERNAKIVFFNFYNSITTKKNKRDKLYFNQQKNTQTIYRKKNLIKQKNYEFYDNIYDNTNYKSNNKNKNNTKKIIIKKNSIKTKVKKNRFRK